MLNEKSEKRPWRADKEALVSFYTEFCYGMKVFVRNAQVEGLFAECTMSDHNDRFDMLTYFIQSWVGGGEGKKVFFWFLKARQHFHSLRINMDA